MNVIVPYAKLNEWLPLCLSVENVEAQYVRMVDDGHYWRLLKELWGKGDGFILVEQYIIPWPGAIRELCDCPEPYCAFPYRLTPGPGGIGYSLGCTKFGTLLIRKYPDAMGKPCSWNTLDGYIKHALPWPHLHIPPVVHLNTERLR